MTFKCVECVKKCVAKGPNFLSTFEGILSPINLDGMNMFWQETENCDLSNDSNDNYWLILMLEKKIPNQLHNF